MRLETFDRPILFYDGRCNLCNGAVQFVLRHEKNAEILFASLQSELGNAVISKHNLQNIDSIVLYDNKQVFIKSQAALAVARRLKTPYSFAAKFNFISPKIRDAIYDLVARSRYKLFGKTNTCQMPDETTKERFIDL